MARSLLFLAQGVIVRKISLIAPLKATAAIGSIDMSLYLRGEWDEKGEEGQWGRCLFELYF